MRIAMVGGRGIPARAGGVERVIEELARELVARGHEVLVYSRGDYVAGTGTPHPGEGVRVITPGFRGKHLDAITHTATAMFDLLRRGVDVVHVHSPGPALMSWVPAAARIPIVLTVHAPDWRRDKWSAPARLMLRAGLGLGMRLASAVTAVSQPLAEELHRRFGREVTYIPNAVRPAEPQSPNTITRWGLQGDDYVLYIGRLVPEKRVDLLLRAWTGVEARWKLVIVGDCQESDYSRRLRVDAGQGVLFLGEQFGQVIAELYSSAAMVVQPSALEGMSMVILEAASYGRCILAADLPENRQILGDSMLYFRVDDASQLTECICRSLKDGAMRCALGRRAKELVSSRYSWPQAAQSVEKVYREARQGT